MTPIRASSSTLFAAAVDLFDGQPQGAPEYAVINVGGWWELFAGQESLTAQNDGARHRGMKTQGAAVY